MDCEDCDECCVSLVFEVSNCMTGCEQCIYLEGCY